MPAKPASPALLSLVDTTEHNGLRGVASLWVLLFHVCVYVNPRVDLQGSALMPLFFALSGFSLAVGYAHRLWAREKNSLSPSYTLIRGDNSATNNTVISSTETVDDISLNNSISDVNHLSHILLTPSVANWLQIRRFYRNRLVRVLPAYWLCFLFAVPLSLAGYGIVDLSPASSAFSVSLWAVNVLPVSTWFAFALGAPLDGPEWTVSTLLFFYLAFPWIVRHYEALSDDALLRAIHRHYWLNVALGVLLFVAGLALGGPGFGFWLSTAWPPSRLPVFIAGMCAGLLCRRWAEREHHTRADTRTECSVEWFACIGYFLPSLPLCLSPSVPLSHTDFLRTLRWQSLSLLVGTLSLSLLQAVGVYVAGNIWFQFLNVFALIEVLVGLVRCSGSQTIMWLRCEALQWLGDVSMSLYLVHWPVIFYLCWMCHGESIHWPDTLECGTHSDSAQRSLCEQEVSAFNTARTPPYWSLIVAPLLSLCLASLLFYLVEEPLRIHCKS